MELAERLQAERRGVPFVLYLEGDGRQRIVELEGGPLLNGRRVRGQQRLADGDVIRVGRTLLVFAAARSQFASTATAPDAAPPELSPFGVPDMPQSRKRAELVRRAFERGVGMEPD